MGDPKTSTLYPYTSITKNKIVSSHVLVEDWRYGAYWSEVLKTGMYEYAGLKPLPTANVDAKTKHRVNRIIRNLEAQRDSERQKEEQYLAAHGITKISPEEFVRKFNEIIQRKEEYDAVLDRLNMGLQSYNNGKGNKGAGKSHATAYDRIYTRFRQVFNINLNNLVMGYLPLCIDNPGTMVSNKIMSDFRSILRNTFETSVKEAVALLGYVYKDGKFVRSNSKIAVGEGYNKENIEQYIDQAEYAVKQLENLLNQNFKIDEKLDQVEKDFKKAVKKGDYKYKPTKLKAAKFDDNSSKGSASEILGMIFSGLIEMNCSPGKTVQRVSGNINSNMYKIDTAIIDSTIMQDLTNVSKLIFELKKPKNLMGSASNFKKLDDETLSKLDGINVVLINQKDYQIDSSTKGFSNGGKFPIEYAPAYAAKGGFSFGSKTNFYRIVYNAMNDAVGAYNQGVLEKSIESGVLSGILFTMFDSFEVLGKTRSSGANVLHAFSLNGIYVPTSVYLDGIINSFKNAGAISSNEWATVKVQWGSFSPESTSGTGASAVATAWNNSWNSARGKTTFTVSFMKNFSSFVSNLK